MTDLLDPPGTRTEQAATRESTLRSPAVTAAGAGLASAAAVLLGCMAVGLVAWFASDAGAHGDTRDAIRVGADGWLLAQGSRLHLGAASATITVVPLGLTLICGYGARRLGQWTARTSAVEDTGT